LLALMQVGCGEVHSKPVDAAIADTSVVADASVDAPPDAPTTYAVAGEMTTVAGEVTSGTLRIQGSLSTAVGGCQGTTCVEGQLVP
jgi:hypothetical protein